MVSFTKNHPLILIAINQLRWRISYPLPSYNISTIAPYNYCSTPVTAAGAHKVRVLEEQPTVKVKVNSRPYVPGNLDHMLFCRTRILTCYQCARFVPDDLFSLCKKGDVWQAFGAQPDRGIFSRPSLFQRGGYDYFVTNRCTIG
jgi:hypothetical protein